MNYQDNSKTAYLAETLNKLVKEEAEILALAKTDKGFDDLVTEELKNIRVQKEAVEKQITEIVAVEKADESAGWQTNEMIMEIRAGVGGEEAALFAEKTRSKVCAGRPVSTEFNECQRQKKLDGFTLPLLQLRFCHCEKKIIFPSIPLIWKWNFPAPAARAVRMSTKWKRLFGWYTNQPVLMSAPLRKEAKHATAKKHW